MKRIALIEDDVDIAYSITLNLEREGYRIEQFANGYEGLLALQQSTFDFLILDLNLPDLDGFTICRELRRDRATSDLPILMLTARAGERDRVTGLDLGADDYMVKPFSMRELSARIAAILRRSGAPSEDAGVYDDGELRVEEKTLRAFVSGAEVHLAKKEFELLWLLIRNRPSVVSRERILTDIWRMADDVESRTLDAHVRNLRKKIGRQRISTVIGTGYRFEPAGAGGASSAAR
jgi:DNA-binding response OmpR family regulator